MDENVDLNVALILNCTTCTYALKSDVTKPNTFKNVTKQALLFSFASLNRKENTCIKTKEDKLFKT